MSNVSYVTGSKPILQGQFRGYLSNLMYVCLTHWYRVNHHEDRSAHRMGIRYVFSEMDKEIDDTGVW